MLKAYTNEMRKRFDEQLEIELSLDEETYKTALMLFDNYSNKELIVFEEIIEDWPSLAGSNILSLLTLFIQYFERHPDEWTAVYSPEIGWILFSEIYTFIESTSDYLEQVISMDDENPDSYLLFRGQSEVTWNLKPSIFRDDNILSESEYYNKIRLREPLAFQNDYILDNIVKMQHYGLPTRLLDITYNPLVALFFACKEQTDSHAIVYVFNEYMSSAYESDEVRILAHSVMVPKGWKTREDFISSVKQKCNLIDGKDNTEIQAIIENNYFINASNHNERIKRQQGAFILFGMDFSKADIPYKSVDESVKQRFIILNEKKEQIIKELEQLGVNEGFIFPELEYQTSYVKNKYKVNEKYTTPSNPPDTKVEKIDERTPEQKQDEYTEQLVNVIKIICKQNEINPDEILKDQEFIKNASIIDWFNKESAIANIRITLKKLFGDRIKSRDRFKAAIYQFVGALEAIKKSEKKN